MHLDEQKYEEMKSRLAPYKYTTYIQIRRPKQKLGEANNATSTSRIA